MSCLGADHSGRVRRRHSSQHDDGDSVLAVSSQDGVQTSISIVDDPPQRRTSGLLEPARRSSGIDVASWDAQTVIDQHLRFSEDVESCTKKGDEQRKSDGFLEQVGNAEEPRDRSLSVNTASAVTIAQSDVVEIATALSPARMTSPPAGSSPRLANRSPQGRNRSMSLRSSLFAKNINHRSQNNSSAFEMHDVGASSADGRSQTRKKGFELSVTISRMLDRRPSPELSRPISAREGAGTSSTLSRYRQWTQRQAARHLPLKRMEEKFEKARKFILHVQDIPPSKDGRQIPLDPSRKITLIDDRTGKPYVANTIRSSKYTVWNFLPRQLFAQFSKLANFYFLCVSILQMIPGLSTTGTYTTIVPLLFFVSLSMAKEGYEDLRRYRLDKDENIREAKVLHAYRTVPATSKDEAAEASKLQGPLHWAPVKWQNLQVGDVIRLERDEQVPADIVLLSSQGTNSIAYVETMALDGETNLKNKQPSAATAATCSTAEKIANGGAMHFVVEDPNLDLYGFEGKVTMPAESTTSPLTNQEILYRGSVLRNTPEAIGMIIYSGEECKIRMNANKNPRIKAPSLQAVVNKIIVMIVVFVVALAVFDTIAYQIWQEKVEEHSWYLTAAGVAFGPIFTGFIIMFNTMIPLSLYVSLEIIKLGQIFLLNDVDMYDEASNTPFKAQTSTINEELGQVSYIFSDKTGTLTENVMRFRKLSVAGTAWLHDVDLPIQPIVEDKLLHQGRKPDHSKGKRPLRMAQAASLRGSMAQEPVSHTGADHGTSNLDAPSTIAHLPHTSTSHWQSSARPTKAQPELSTTELIRYIQRRPNTAFARKARTLILSMAVCHTCLPERRGGDEEVSFQASSPDEIALVQAAKELGFLAFERDGSSLTLKLYPHGLTAETKYESYEVLDIIEFSSRRKRMSVILRFPNGRICVICKGADSMLVQRLRLATLANQKISEIGKRVDERKSLEVQQAMRRKSSQTEHQGSVGNLPRAPAARTSMSRTRTSRLAPIRDEVDGWLREREREVDASNAADTTSLYTPRPSAQYVERGPLAYSEHRSSLHAETEHELVEEALVVDDAAVIERCLQHINDFATEGLRTLLYGHRFLYEDEYRVWKKVYNDATTSLLDRQGLIEKAGELIEQQLELTGVTAIEDKLQKGVPETIDRLRRANIKMWMLTGDKRETAMNIGHSCRLIKDYSSVTVLDYEAGQVERKIAAAITDISTGGVAHSVVIIDGQTLSMINTEESQYTLFLDLAVLADSVVCCRASPSQKANLVHAIRLRVEGSVTLAIGDGANDIAMIQEAHIGIGITGKEGLQAARTSDYAIAQFRFLTKLLLVHGRWNYVRTCKYTVGTFYKEMLFYLTQALYQRWNGYSGTSMYESWSLSMFNTLFTSLPVIFLGIFEKDLLASTLIAVPELYNKGQRAGGFNVTIYFGWMFMAAAEAMVIYFVMSGLFGQAVFTTDNSLFAMGDLTFTACIVLISIKLQVLEIHNHSVTALFAVVVSVGGWFLWNIILSAIYGKNGTYDVKAGFLDRSGRNALWWLTLILIVSACCLFEIGARSLKAAYCPTDVEAFQALEKDLHVRKRFEEASASELQAGWHHGEKESSIELQRDAVAQVEREGEIQDLLDKPRVMEEGRSQSTECSLQTEVQPVRGGDESLQHSADIQDMLAKTFGSVRPGTLSRS